MYKVIITFLFSFALISCEKSEKPQVSGNESKQVVLNSNDSLPDAQKELQSAIKNLPNIPKNVLGTREEEKYIQPLLELRDKWASKVGSTITDWECTITDKEQTLASDSVKAVYCTPNGMTRYTQINAFIDVSENDKFYLGDKLLISGTIQDISISPLYKIEMPNGYSMAITSATVKLKK